MRPMNFMLIVARRDDGTGLPEFGIRWEDGETQPVNLQTAHILSAMIIGSAIQAQTNMIAAASMGSEAMDA